MWVCIAGRVHFDFSSLSLSSDALRERMRGGEGAADDSNSTQGLQPRAESSAYYRATVSARCLVERHVD